MPKLLRKPKLRLIDWFDRWGNRLLSHFLHFCGYLSLIAFISQSHLECGIVNTTGHFERTSHKLTS